MPVRVAIVGLIAGTAVACGRSPGPATSERTAPPESSSPAAVAPVAPVTLDAAPAVAAAPVAPSAPARPGRGDTCKADPDCGWDDPCMATRCGKAVAPVADRKCSESAPPPGTCACVDSQCTGNGGGTTCGNH